MGREKQYTRILCHDELQDTVTCAEATNILAGHEHQSLFTIRLGYLNFLGRSMGQVRIRYPRDIITIDVYGACVPSL